MPKKQTILVTPLSMRVDQTMKDWLTRWATEHASRLNGEPNMSEAARMALEMARIIDSDPEYMELINHEFAGDYRMLILRACNDYLTQYKEANEHATFQP